MCPAVFRVGLLIFAEPILNPPALTLLVEWQPEPLQSSAPIGMWLAEVDVIVILANVAATDGPWQLRQSVTPWCVPVTEKRAKLSGVV